MSSRQKIAFEPAFALVLAEHGIQHEALGRKKLVVLLGFGLPLPAGDLEHRAQKIGDGFVGTEQAEIALIQIEPYDLAQDSPRTRVS